MFEDLLRLQGEMAELKEEVLEHQVQKTKAQREEQALSDAEQAAKEAVKRAKEAAQLLSAVPPALLAEFQEWLSNAAQGKTASTQEELSEPGVDAPALPEVLALPPQG